MQASRPRYVLIAESCQDEAQPHWRFALQSADAAVTVAASDAEPGADADRLTLLAVVRGLEALDQPAEVTIVTRCASVLRGMTRGLPQWRNNHWRWERFGRLTPIRDADLWRRVDQALQFHSVQCRSWRTGRAHDGPPRPHFGRPVERASIVEGRPDSPAMVIVRSSRSRRRVRFDEPAMAG